MMRIGHNIWLCGLFVLFTLLTTLLTKVVFAASIGIKPQEILLSDSTPFVDATLFNMGNQPVQLRLELVDLAMTEDDRIIEVADPNDGGGDGLDDGGDDADGEDRTSRNHHPFAANLLRVAPRQIVIPPNGTHEIRILARRGRMVADGAYHTHLFMKIVPSLEDFSEMATSASSPTPQTPPPESSGESANGAVDERPQTTIGVIPIISVAHPIWLEKGDGLEAQARLGTAALILDQDTADDGASDAARGDHDREPHDREPMVHLQLDRTGTGRLKGELALFASFTGDANEVMISRTRKLNIYPEISRLATSIRIDMAALAAAGMTQRHLATGEVSVRVQFTRTVPAEGPDAVQSITLTPPDMKG